MLTLFLLNWVLFGKNRDNKYFYVNVGDDKWIEVEIVTDEHSQIDTADITAALMTMFLGVQDVLYTTTGGRYKHLNVIKSVQIKIPTVSGIKGDNNEIQYIPITS